MSVIRVPYFATVGGNTPLQEITASLDQIEANIIQRSPWPAGGYEPSVSFALAYSATSILLKYYVQEKSARAIHGSSNGRVHEDSCVEFFISFDGDAEYYNLEFNCIGTCLVGYGKVREGRQLLPEETIRGIKRRVVIEPVVKENRDFVYWELVAYIPFEVFVYHNLVNLPARACKANFYKCGDHLPEPHFLTWNNIIAIVPDFHLPEFFGELHFV
jgi:hypothetical protein